MAKQAKYMQVLKQWQHPGNYSGEEYYDYYCGPGQSRDSEILEQSNFLVALEQLGGESKTVIVTRAGHWAVGWVEQILVHKSDKKSLKKLSEIMTKLNDYPVLDESDYSEREYEYYSEYADGAKKDLAKALKKHFNLPKSISLKSLQGVAYQLNMEAQFDGGPTSCVNIYQSRTPDARDIKELKHLLGRTYLSHLNKKELKAFNTLLIKVNTIKLSEVEVES